MLCRLCQYSLYTYSLLFSYRRGAKADYFKPRSALEMASMLYCVQCSCRKRALGKKSWSLNQPGLPRKKERERERERERVRGGERERQANGRAESSYVTLPSPLLPQWFSSARACVRACVRARTHTHTRTCRPLNVPIQGFPLNRRRVYFPTHVEKQGV